MGKLKLILAFIKGLKNNKFVIKAIDKLKVIINNEGSKKFFKTKVGAVILTVIGIILAILEVAMNISTLWV